MGEAPQMIDRLWKNRWLRAGVAAAALGAWPACMATHGDDDVPSAGTPSLDFVLKDMDGNDVRLADFKGRPLLVNFWATWCPPCRAEVPWLIEFADKYRDEGLAVLGISVDDAPEDIRAFAAEYDVNYPMLVGLGHDELREAYDASAVIPVSWLIKADGTVFAKAQGIHAKEWFESKIRAMF
jgi:cytochrome c biogenesis protein CcmG/thiol:disulfide interchange protein DsbE